MILIDVRTAEGAENAHTVLENALGNSLATGNDLKNIDSRPKRNDVSVVVQNLLHPE